jgi:zinc/manganese transport system substrate-binding protein
MTSKLFQIFISNFIFFFTSTELALASKIKITSSFSILSALSKEIGGEKIEAYSLIGANREPHEFSPKSSDIVKLNQSKIFFINGLGFEPWSDKLIESSQFKGKTIIASKGVIPLKDGHTIDPHAWQDPRNLKIYADNLTQVLIEMDSDSKDYFNSRNLSFQNKMDHLYKNTNEKITKKNKKLTLFINHGAFNYFAKAFQIEFISLFDLGFSKEPSAKKIASLIKELKAKEVKYYAIEKGSSPQSVKQIAEALNLIFIGSLYADTLESDTVEISSIYEKNLEVLLSLPGL